MEKIIKIMAYVSGISISILILLAIRINYLTNILRKNIKSGNEVSFYIGEIRHYGIVEKVYYDHGVKTVEINSMEGEIQRPVSEIYLSF